MDNFDDFMEAMKYTYPATITGNKDGIYIDPRNCETHIDARKATNYNTIDFTGVNGISIYRYDNGDFYIFQAGGYTPDRGLFCDMYTEDKT